MLQTMKQSPGNVLGYRLSGDIAKADTGTFGPVVAALVKHYGSVDPLPDVTDLHWEKASALPSDIKLGQKFSGKIDKLAMVSDTKWLKKLAKLAAPFGAKEFRTFESANCAWDWLKGKRSGGLVRRLAVRQAGLRRPRSFPWGGLGEQVCGSTARLG